MTGLAGRSVIVSGAARGMGAAHARLLASRGAHVVLGDVLEPEGEALAAELGPTCRFLRHDVTSAADWAEATALAESLAPLRGLVNNAAIYLPRALMDTTPESFEAHTRVNQFGTFLGLQAAVPAMQRAGAGSIVNISSTAGLRGSPTAFAYAATKWAVRGMTKSAAADLGPLGIRVNSVHPGPIDTAMLRVRTEAERDHRRTIVPLRRFGEPEEVAELVAFLLSDHSRFITGAELAIDGGVTL